MANEFYAISDGTFTLSETEKKNQFYFYRNDGNVLNGIGREPMDLYQAYIMHKMMNGESTDMVANNIQSELSRDGICIRLTVYDIGEKTVRKTNLNVREQKPNFFKRLLHKIFG
jgi:hypothetical protein